MSLRALFVLAMFNAIPCWAATDPAPRLPTPEKILGTLRADHPRVMARPETFEAIKAQVAKGGVPGKLYAEVKRSADQMLSAPVSKCEKPDG